MSVFCIQLVTLPEVHMAAGVSVKICADNLFLIIGTIELSAALRHDLFLKMKSTSCAMRSCS